MEEAPHTSLQAPQQLQERTHPVVVVTDFDDGLVLPEIPHGGSAAGAGRSQDVLDLPVPCNAADVLQRLPHTQQPVTTPPHWRLKPCYFQDLLSEKSARRLPRVLGVFWLLFYTRCRVQHLKTLIYKLPEFPCEVIFCFTVLHTSYWIKTKHNCLQEQKITSWKYIQTCELLFCLGLLGFYLAKKKKVCLEEFHGDFYSPQCFLDRKLKAVLTQPFLPYYF